MSDAAQKSFELANDVKTVVSLDEIFKYDEVKHSKLVAAKPWDKDPHYFSEINISALALLKMVMHAKSGGRLEIMGLLLGKIMEHKMFVMDSFALPVEGTETRVNAQSAAYEYMTAYIESAKKPFSSEPASVCTKNFRLLPPKFKLRYNMPESFLKSHKKKISKGNYIYVRKVGRLENAIGWYHSHPGYGCWLSGIDVSTQMLNQQFQEPFVAIVIDPIRTVSAGKVNLGAFRTYPKGFKPANQGPSEYQTIPLEKIEDFGIHCKQYYSLDVKYFKSSLDAQLLDLLWNKYWVDTLSSSPLTMNPEYTTLQINDLSHKLEQAECQNTSTLPLGSKLGASGAGKEESKLAKASRDSCKTGIEAVHGLMLQVIKDKLFNQTNVIS